MGGKNPVVVLRGRRPGPGRRADRPRARSGSAARPAPEPAASSSSTRVHDACSTASSPQPRRLRVGDGLADGVQMGPSPVPPSSRSYSHYLDIGGAEGATLRRRRGRPRRRRLDDGYFVRPTVFTDVDPDVAAGREEVFGPVLAFLRVRLTSTRRVSVANDTAYGLVAGIVTADLGRALRASPAGSKRPGQGQSADHRHGDERPVRRAEGRRARRPTRNRPVTR